MRIIITGGTGLVGRALTENLAGDGNDVIILSRSPEKAAGFPPGVKVVGWDAHTSAGWGELADGADAIVNLAGENLAGSTFFPQRWTAERKKLIKDSRIQAGQAVYEAIKAASNKPSVLIQASALGYYGETGDQKITEESPAGSDFLAQVCVEWENITKDVEAMGVRRAVTRGGVVLSNDSGAFPRVVFPFRFFVGGPLGNGKQWFPWIHLEDEVRAIRFLIENGRASGAFNLCTPNPVTNRQFAKVLGKIMKRPAFIPAPAFALKLAFGEAAALVLDGWQAYPTRLQDLGFEFKYLWAEDAVRELLGK